MKFLRVAIAFGAILSMSFATTVSANTFGDVPATHPASEAIRWVTNPDNGSYMVGDASNNFNPGRAMDSFEGAVVLATAAGFNSSPGSITPEAQAIFNLAYERHGATLNAMATQHPSWRRAANREIAFLMEMGILNQSDLTRFIISGANNTGSVAPLTREVAVALVLRLSGNQEAVNVAALPAVAPFGDNEQINTLYRRYAFVAHEKGVVSLNNGHFSPRQVVTRGEFAQMLFALRIAVPDVVTIPVQGSGGSVQTEQVDANNIQGNLVSRHFVNETPALVIEDIGGNRRTFFVTDDLSIVRNGTAQEWSDLRIGDAIVAQIKMGQLASIQAQGSRSSGQVGLSELHITENLSTLTVRRSDGVYVSLALLPEIYDVYYLRLGMELQLSLESREIYELVVLGGADVSVSTNASFIGQIQSLRHGHTIVVSVDEAGRQTIRVDGNTIDTATGRIIDFSRFRNQQRIYIVMQPDSDTAQSITFLP